MLYTPVPEKARVDTCRTRLKASDWCEICCIFSNLISTTSCHFKNMYIFLFYVRQSELWAQKDVLSSRLHSLDSDLTGITTRVQALEHPQAGAGSKPSLDFTPLQHPPPPPPPQSPPQSPPPPMKVQRSTTLDFRKPVAVAAASEEVPIAAFSISGGGGGGGGEVPPLGQETPILMICFEVRYLPPISHTTNSFLVCPSFDFEGWHSRIVRIFFSFLLFLPSLSTIHTARRLPVAELRGCAAVSPRRGPCRGVARWHPRGGESSRPILQATNGQLQAQRSGKRACLWITIVLVFVAVPNV
jgi:hypothetical protein